jgi:hypothetical protein
VRQRSQEASVEAVGTPAVDYDALLAAALEDVAVEDGAEVSVALMVPAQMS